MAVTNCEELSNIISLGIISGDDDLAKEIARLSADKKDALMRAGKLKGDEDIDSLTGWSAHVLELKASSADIQMRAIVQAKILSGDLMGVRGADAYRELAEQIRREGGTIAGGVELLEKLRNASPVDYENIAKQWGGAYADDPAKAVEEMKQAISENISANYSIRQYSEIKSRAMESLRKQLREGEISQGVFDDEVKKLHKEAMAQIAKGENPNKFAKLDEEWDTIKKIFGDDPTAKGKAWSQFIMARELLSDGGIDDKVLAAFKDMGAENLTGALTKDQIAEAEDLDKLLARAYTNTEQLYKDGELRQLYRDKLVELTAGMGVSKEDLSKAKSIMQTMEFAEKGATFSDIVTADNAYRSASKRGIKVKDGNQLLHGIKKFAEKMGEDPNILKEPIKIAGAEFKPIDLIQIIYDITQDENILKLFRIGFFPDGTVLSVATSRLLGGTEAAADRILRLFSKAKEAPKVSNIRDTSLKAICGDEIKEGASMGFFDFRKSLYQKDELNRPKADFFDKLAEKNKMRVDSTDIKEIKNTDDVNVLAEELKKYKGGYVIVNDSQWRANSTFSEAFDLANKDLKDEEKITALFPRGGLSSSFTMEDGQLFFKTLYDDIYRDVAGTISIQTLGEARPTREILASAYEAATGRNGDKLRYQASYNDGGVDSLGRQISDQQVEYFARSAARDENGNLMVFYHGTNAKFDTFDINAARRSSDIQGMFFSEWEEEARGYGPNVGEYYLNIINPAPADVAYKVWDKYKGQTDAGVFAREELQRMGYDGVQSYQGEWIVFDSNQIKTVDNRLPTVDPNMHFQLVGGPRGATLAEVDEAINDGIILFHSSTDPNLKGFVDVEELKKNLIEGQKMLAEAEKEAQAIRNKYPEDMYTRSKAMATEYMKEMQPVRKKMQQARGLGLEYDGELLNRIGRNGSLGGEGIYVTSRPYEREGVLSQQGINIGDNIYAIYIPKGAKEYKQMAGLGRELPEAVIQHNEGIVLGKIDPTGDLVGEARRLLNSNIGLPIPDRDIAIVDRWNNLVKQSRKTGDFSWAYDYKLIENYYNNMKSFLSQFDKRDLDVLKKYSKVWKNITDIEGWAKKNGIAVENLIAFTNTLYDLEGALHHNIHIFDDISISDYYKFVGEGNKLAIDVDDVVLHGGRSVDGIFQTQADIDFMRRLGQYADQPDIPVTDALKVQMFTKNRTWQQIADGYGFSIEYVHGTDMIQGVKAYGAYGNGVIYFTDIVKESTPPHELFHGIFNMYVRGQDSDMYERVLRESSELFGVSEYKAEEILADSFAEWFRTGEFTYGEKLKKEAEEMLAKEGKIKKKGLNKEQKSLIAKVLEYFKEIARQLGILDNHRAEVKQMFEDMVNMQYLPDAGKSVNATEAMMKYNNELDASAANYFGRLLGQNTPENIDKEYIDKVQNMLSERLGIDMKTFEQMTDRSALWQKVDEKFTLERFTTGRYDRQVVDINAEKNKIASYTDDKLEEEIKKDLGDILIRGNIKGNKDVTHIREAYLDYKLAANAVDSLAAKGKIISLANGGTAKTMSMQQVRDMFTNGTFEKVYKEMFFPNQTLTNKEMKDFISAINNNIFDTLSIQFAENLVDAGYSLPLMNIRSFVYEYLRGTLDLNNKFVEAFLYKNKIPYTVDGLKSIVDTLMPTEFRFDYEKALFKGRLGEMEQGSISTVREIKNRFLPESYSAIAAVEMAKGADIGLNYEKDILNGILDKYVNAVLDGVKAGTLDFQGAQGLKQEAGYALDMFEQDYLLPRYGKFLSKQERQGITNLKSLLPIGVKGQNVDRLREELISIRTKINQRYSMTLSNAAKNNDINMSILRGLKGADEKMQKAIDERRQQLIDSGGIIKEVNGQYLVYDVKQALAWTIAQLPQNIGGLEGIKALGRAGIEGLTNKQAYAILRYLEAAKGLSATANLATDLIYKINPRLLQYNFFQSYKVGKQGIPIALEGNLLNMDKFLSKFDNISGLDNIAKKNIFEGIVNKFRQQSYLTTKDLDKIISDGVKEAQASFRQIQFSPKDAREAANRMALVYRKVFEPYVHVKDIPKGGVLIDGITPVRDIKKKVENAMKQQYNQAVKDLKAVGIDDIDSLQTAIYITTNDGEKISLKKAGEMNIDSWKKNIFNDEGIFIAGADDLKKFEGSPDDKAKVAEQKDWRNGIISEYDSALSSMLSQTEYISKAERDLTTAFMNDARTSMRQYTLTNKIVDALDSLSGLNEEAARGIKDYLIGWKGNISFGKRKPKQILDRNELVKTAYREYYAMDLTKLNSVSPTSRAEDLALRLAKYFKNLERLLGSADGLTGCTTSETLNRAFFHIGEVVMNVDTVKGVFGLLSGVEQNQILKFFKFAKGQLAKDADVFIRRGKGNFQESLGGYRDYVEEISGISRDTFNEIFASNFSEGDFKRILQGLTGFTLTGSWGRKATQILNLLNGSNFLFRFLMSYPGQLLTIPQQSLAYFLKQIGFERQLGVESMSDVDAVRMNYGVLDGAYNELVIRGKSTVSPDDLRLDSYYNRYGIPDVDEIYRTSSIETADDYINMYAKIDNHAASSISATNKWLRQLDPYKDNANNIIDGLFARNFKNISFLKAIRGNDFLQFGSAKEFMSFMDDPRISAEVKTRLMDRVSAYSGRNFRNILGLGFGGIDRAIAGSGFGNIMYGLMQLFNFRGSWGQNIFKQTGANFFTALKMLTTSKGVWSNEGREALAEYIARQPEFTNFVGALFNDLRWTWKLQRFQDNGRWPDDEDFYDAMDFIEYMTDTLNMTSQWFQGLQSFGPFRPIWEQGVSIFNSHMNPTIYKDTFGVGAFFNALGKNFGRQWKPYNWIAKWVGAWTTGGPSEAMAYLESEWRKLSFGSLRYMVNEDQNAYGYTYEMTGQAGGIPSILMGESRLGSDKNFSYEIDNTETWETIGQIFNGDIPWDSRWTYIGNLGKAFVNGSQLAALPKSVYRAIARKAPSYSTANDLAEYMQKSEAGLEFYRNGVVTPKTPQEAETFFNTLLANAKYRPGSSNFTKSLIQYEDYGHMDGKEGKKADAEMELRLDHMKHLTNSHGEFETHGGEKVVDPSWTKLIEDVKAHGYNETYTTNLIYNYAKTWLNNHSSDPNYQLYVKMLGQGQAHNLIEYKTNQVLEVLNLGKKGKDNKWTKTELEDVGLDIELLLQLGNSKIEGEDVTLFEKLQRLDEDDATVAALQIIQSQLEGGDRKKLDKFFEVEEQDDGSKVISLKYQYENTLKQIGAVAKAIDDGDADLVVAEASTLVNMYKSKDPTGAVTATLIDSVYNRIYDTNSFTPEQKQAAMIALFHKNKDFIQRNPDKLREFLGDDYDIYADYMNQMLYQWDGMTISNLESMQSSGKSSSKSSAAGANLSSALKSLSNSIGGSGGNRGTGSTATYKEWVPVVIKGANLVQELGLKGYTPEVKNLKVNSYKPHIDLSPKKDINRTIKGPKTESVSTKKQLSNLEEKATKALEAES